MPNTKDELKCPKCGSSQVQTRVKTKERYCRRCGTEWKMEDKPCDIK